MSIERVRRRKSYQITEKGRAHPLGRVLEGEEPRRADVFESGLWERTQDRWLEIPIVSMFSLMSVGAVGVVSGLVNDANGTTWLIGTMVGGGFGAALYALFHPGSYGGSGR